MTIEVLNECDLYMLSNLSGPPRHLLGGEKLQPYHEGFIVPKKPNPAGGICVYVLPKHTGGNCRTASYSKVRDMPMEFQINSSHNTQLHIGDEFKSEGITLRGS